MNLTPEQLQMLAERLGYEWIKTGQQGMFRSPVFQCYKRPAMLERSDGDLLLAILNRAAEMGERIDLSFLPIAKVWGMGPTQSPNRVRQYADNPLEAAILAFIQLPHMSNADSKSMTGEG